MQMKDVNKDKFFSVEQFEGSWEQLNTEEKVHEIETSSTETSAKNKT
jgi:hypothetical protein